MTSEQTPLVVRLYGLLARLVFPRAFMDAHGSDLVRLFEDLLREARRRRSLLGGVVVTVQEMASLLRGAIRERGPEPDIARLYDGNAEGWTAMMGNAMRDLKFAVRTMLKKPTLTLAAVVTLALGIGGTTAIFSIVRGVLLQTLPYAGAERVVYLEETTVTGRRTTISYENFRDWQRQAESFEAITVFMGNSVNVTGGERPERIRGIFTTAEYFDVAGVQLELGRGILPGEDEPGGERTAVLSYGYWQSRYGGDRSVLGRTIVLNNEIHTIVGVMPADFKPFWDTASAWISLHTLPRAFNRTSRTVIGLARLKPGVSIERAQDEMDRIMGHGGAGGSLPGRQRRQRGVGPSAGAVDTIQPDNDAADAVGGGGHGASDRLCQRGQPSASPGRR